MYMPKQLVYESRSTYRNKSSRSSLLLSLLALLIIIGGAAWTFWNSKHDPELGRQTQMLLHDAEQLWNWSDTNMKHGAAAAQWSVRWDLTAELDQVQLLADTLFRNEAGEPLEKLVEKDGALIKGSIDEFGSQLSIHSFPSNGKRDNLMVLYTSQTGAIADQADLLKRLTYLSAELSVIDAAFSNSMKVQGRTASSNAVNAFAMQSHGEEIDRYEDGGTISVTMYTKQLQHLVKTKEGMRANVQIATHQLTDEPVKLLTIGIPFISGDYTSERQETKN